MRVSTLYQVLAIAASASACDSCYGPQDNVVHTRNVRRMQPDAQNATVQPRAPLDWGMINFLHTTDTHGWLEGHIKEQNYGADWGDFVSFTRHMRHKAENLGVDLLLVDTGDLHDGAGLSDATSPNGKLSNPVFENVDYDLLTIGNHELYVTEIAYETFSQFSKVYGEKYITSNVQIINPATGKFEYIGSKYRYFTTNHGLRIMSFGVLFDFTGNSNVSKVIKTADLVKESWFLDAVNYKQPIDLFVVIGHNPIRPSASSSTFGTLYKTIRSTRPEIPIQGFGGHSHVRDFVVFDEMSTGLESGRYCETLGWISMSGIDSKNFKGNIKPRGVPNPSTPAIKVVPKATGTGSVGLPLATSTPKANASSSSMVYSRRYLDWNRLTFAYHAVGSQDNTFDYHSGERVTADITNIRKELNLTTLFGCAPETYCQSCKPFGADGNIFGLLEIALSTVVVNESRVDTPRLVLINTGSVRFDLVKGPFTYDDSFIVSPFKDGFQFIPNVPYTTASRVLDIINNAPDTKKKRDLSSSDFNFPALTVDGCVDPTIGSIASHDSLKARSDHGITRRQTSKITPGYVTIDDFSSNGGGDDTQHSKIPNYPQPQYIQANASFPADKSAPKSVDLIFLDYIAPDVLSALKGISAPYTTADVSYYLPQSFTTNSYLPAYAKVAWQANVPNCPVGMGVGQVNK